MARRKRIEESTVIHLDGWGGWRIVGDGVSWQLQQQDGNLWKARQTFPSLLSASLAAYDYALMGTGFELNTIGELCNKIESTMQQLADEIRKAVDNG